MSKGLLQKARAIHRILQNIAGKPVDFMEMAGILAQTLECNAYVVGRRGQLIGYAFGGKKACPDMEKVKRFAEAFPETFNQEYSEIQETKANVPLSPGRCLFKAEDVDCPLEGAVMTIVPVFGGGKRLGTLVLTKEGQEFADEDIVLAELGAIVVANEVMRMRADRIEEEVRKKAAVQVAVATLSYSEREAIEHILAELNGTEGLLVASRIADKVGITRSVIVSALRKFESAGVIESRSLGMKGTYIKVLNENLFDELKRS